MKDLTENTIPEEMAFAEFERFGEMMDLDFDTSLMDEDEERVFAKAKTRLVTALKRGSLIINDDGEAVYTPSNSKTKHKDPITFHERTGESVTSSLKANGKQGNPYASMANVTRVHPKVFVNMVGIDIKTCEAIFALLMD